MKGIEKRGKKKERNVLTEIKWKKKRVIKNC